MPPLPARMRPPQMPKAPVVPAAGQWVWTCRAGFESHLYEELAWAKRRPALMAPGLVASAPPSGFVPVFARMGFPLAGVATNPAEAMALLGTAGGCLQVWVPDTDAGNRLAPEANAFGQALSTLRSAANVTEHATPWKAFEAGAQLPQVCLVTPALVLVGSVLARDAFSLAAGGRMRMKRAEASPSRAAMKLDEALEWLGMTPGKGDACADLGSAPGGWTKQLVGRGARVLSVDPAKLAPDVLALPRVKHIQESAFAFAPSEPVDWLFCDMAWRPLEVAQLLGKWARNRWARQLVANFKLPMKDKLPTVARVRWTLEQAGWKALKARQLYHDRDEITVTATVI